MPKLNYNNFSFKEKKTQQSNALLVELATMRNTCASEGLLETAVFVEKFKMDFAILRSY